MDSAELEKINRQAGCEKGPKYVEINYMLDSVIYNTFDRTFVIFDYDKNKFEIQTPAPSPAENSSNSTVKQNQTEALSILTKVNVKILDEYPTCCSEYMLPLNYVK